ncbi:MAG TPA: hypothetical protein O0Y09_00420 [Methanocorpusculum sp.]|nr:hypothetical protein [Methanocorpusculum sp.]HJK32282.1 hypothetical protein [Methanocorpusculum sp.]HJK44193.1 hypothetical protein [Methanocorpusculum sp.]
MEFGSFRFATVHKQYLLFCGPAPQECGTPGPNANGFLAYCWYEPPQGLVCLILAETFFENGDLTVVREISRDAPVIVSADRLSACSSTPVRRGVFDFSRFSWAEELADKADPAPPESSRVPLSRICGMCVHHFGRSGWQRCPAFPEGIPTELWNAETDPLIPCGKGLRFSEKKRRLFLEVFDAATGRVIFRYEGRGDPRCPEQVRESSDISASALATFQGIMDDWYSHLAEPTKEALHCTEHDGAFIRELSAINVVMTINKQTGREVYRIIDEFPEF